MPSVTGAAEKCADREGLREPPLPRSLEEVDLGTSRLPERGLVVDEATYAFAGTDEIR